MEGDALDTTYWGYRAWMCHKPDLSIKESLMHIFEKIRLTYNKKFQQQVTFTQSNAFDSFAITFLRC